MEKEDLKIYLHKKVRLILKSGYNYHGYVLSLGDDFIRFKDKYNRMVIVKLDDISLIEEFKEWAMKKEKEVLK